MLQTNVYSLPSLILYPGPILKVALVLSMDCASLDGPWSYLSFCFCRIPVQIWFIILPSLGPLGDASSGPFLSCLLAAVPLRCITSPFFSSLASCLDPGSAFLLQTHLVITRPGLIPVSPPELLDSPCVLPVPAATLATCSLDPQEKLHAPCLERQSEPIIFPLISVEM